MAMPINLHAKLLTPDIIDIETKDFTSSSPKVDSSTRLYVGNQFKVKNTDGSEFEYQVNDDGISVTLKKGDAKGVSKLIIPSIVEGLGSHFFVTDIADSAFETFFKSPMKGVKLLEIKDGIRNIGEYCFKGAKELENVLLPASLKKISYQTFALCSNLKEVEIHETSELYAIGNLAFQDCISLNHFTIPSSVTAIGTAPWMGCTSLRCIGLAEGNYNLVVDDGVLYSDWQGNIIQYPAGKTDKVYHPLFGTKAICEEAFYGNPYIEKVVFPASLDSIYYGAFGNCVSLQDVEFNSKDVFIDRAAFYDCPQLKVITLYGVPGYAILDGQSKTFDDETKIVIKKEIDNVKLPKSKFGILSSVWDFISKMTYFYIDETEINSKVGLPKYFGTGKATIYGNAGPKKDVLNILEAIPAQLLELENIDDKGRIKRLYLDKSNEKNPRILYFFGGIGGNDLVVALFENGNLKKIEKMIKDTKLKPNM